jgi:hypothetical protein
MKKLLMGFSLVVGLLSTVFAGPYTVNVSVTNNTGSEITLYFPSSKNYPSSRLLPAGKAYVSESLAVTSVGLGSQRYTPKRAFANGSYSVVLRNGTLSVESK